ncbi:MAG TPA: hypothetical protein VL574_06900 [Stellaceae bacterium]|jgi:hypothetical protein|nr:hypothetical protein [Stellaceae bacterium]
MSTQIEQLIDEGLAQARVRASCADVAYGLVAALKRIYALIEEIAGPTTMPMLDGCLRNRIILRSLRLTPRLAGPAASLPLPVAGPHAALAETILVSAAESCLATKSLTSEEGDIFMLAFIMIDRLFELLGGVPDAGELLARLRDDDEDLRIDGEASAEAPVMLRH